MNFRFLRFLTAAAIAAGLVGGATLAHADGMTSEQAQQILDELKAIHKSLDARPVAAPQPAAAAPQDDKVSMAFPPGGFSVGKENAPLVLVEYTDYQCPFCQRYHNDSFAQIKSNFIDTGKLRYISRDFRFRSTRTRAAARRRLAAQPSRASSGSCATR